MLNIKHVFNANRSTQMKAGGLTETIPTEGNWKLNLNGKPRRKGRWTRKTERREWHKAEQDLIPGHFQMGECLQFPWGKRGGTVTVTQFINLYPPPPPTLRPTILLLAAWICPISELNGPLCDC